MNCKEIKKKYFESCKIKNKNFNYKSTNFTENDILNCINNMKIYFINCNNYKNK